MNPALLSLANSITLESYAHGVRIGGYALIAFAVLLGIRASR